MKLILGIFLFALLWAVFTPVYFIANLGGYCDRRLDAFLKHVFDDDDDDDDDMSFGV